MQLGFKSVPETPLGEQDWSGVPLEENALTDMKGVTKVTAETATLIVDSIIVNNTKDLTISLLFTYIIYTFFSGALFD